LVSPIPAAGNTFHIPIKCRFVCHLPS
jgi:hypothetical protein